MFRLKDVAVGLLARGITKSLSHCWQCMDTSLTSDSSLRSYCTFLLTSSEGRGILRHQDSHLVSWLVGQICRDSHIMLQMIWCGGESCLSQSALNSDFHWKHVDHYD